MADILNAVAAITGASIDVRRDLERSESGCR